MITIFKNRKDIPGDMEYVELNDLFFNQNTVSFIDKQADKMAQSLSVNIRFTPDSMKLHWI